MKTPGFELNANIAIPLAELSFTFARSSGPGGQNVNKVNSKAILHWNIKNSSSLPKDVLSRFMEKYANQITASGELLISSQKYRDQKRNIDNCLEKLAKMIAEVAEPPAIRKVSKPSLGSKLKRLENKRQQAAKKQLRRTNNLEG